MLVFHAAAGLYALFMLWRHVPLARRGRPVSIAVCLAALVVLALSSRALLSAVHPG